MGADGDFMARLRVLLRERAGLRAEQAAEIEAELRREFGARTVYVQRHSKRARLAELQALPADLSTRERAAAIGASERWTRTLSGLLR